MFRKMKIMAVVAVLSAFSIMLSGCSFSIISVEKLVRPPYPSDDMRYVQEAFYDDVEKSITLLTPQNGEYRTSFLMYDLDADKQEEAIVFYLADDGNAYLNILKKSNDEWKTECVFKGYGNAVDFISFIDMNTDENPEILVGWSRVDSTTVAKYFTVLTLDKLSKSFKISSLINENYTLITTADIDNDKDTDILITVLDTTQNTTKAYARMFSYQDGVDTVVAGGTADQNVLDAQSGAPVVTKVTEIPLDGNITSYYKIYSESTETENIFYIDAYKGDFQMITEVLVCEKAPETANGIVEKNALMAPLIDESTLTMTATWRGFDLPARDIDKDGNLEIPVQTVVEADDTSAIDQAETEIGITDWVRYRNGELESARASFVSAEGDYYIYIDNDIRWQIKAKSNKTNNTMKLYANTSVGPQTELLHLCEFSKADWEIMCNSSEELEYTLLSENKASGSVYVYKLTPYGQNDFSITARYVEENFVVI